MKRFLITVFLTLLLDVAISQVSARQTGKFAVTSTVIDLLGEESAQAFKEKIAVDQLITWEVYVPANYDPEKPAGVLVFVNSRNSGKIETEWKAVMDSMNLIYISANESGNDIDVPIRVAYAILAPRVMLKNYAIDPERIYVSGFSGGSRVASMVAPEYNSLFKGAIYNSGANFWGESALQRYREMADQNYVFITGTEDFNLEDTKEVYNAYLEAGIDNSKLVVIPGMGHKRPAAEYLESAIQYLDLNQD